MTSIQVVEPTQAIADDERASEASERGGVQVRCRCGKMWQALAGVTSCGKLRHVVADFVSGRVFSSITVSGRLFGRRRFVAGEWLFIQKLHSVSKDGAAEVEIAVSPI